MGDQIQQILNRLCTQSSASTCYNTIAAVSKSASVNGNASTESMHQRELISKAHWKTTMTQSPTDPYAHSCAATHSPEKWRLHKSLDLAIPLKLFRHWQNSNAHIHTIHVAQHECCAAEPYNCPPPWPFWPFDVQKWNCGSLSITEQWELSFTLRLEDEN